MNALAAVVGSALALIGAVASGSRGEITFTAATSFPKVFTLYGVRSDGSGLRVILRGASHPAWSRDGSRLVFYGARGFYVADAKGRHLRLVLRASCGFGSDDAWSPDGSMLALACNTTGDPRSRSRIVVVGANGTKAHRVRAAGGAGDPQLGGLAWSPNGAMLAFFETRLSKTRRLYGSLVTITPNGARAQTLAAVHGFVSLDDRPSWRRGGSTLAFRSDPRHFAMLDLRAHRVTRFVRGTSPVFSPDGRRLAFLRDGEYVARADGSEAVRVCRGALAVWSPDSRELAYVGPSVAVVGADGRNRRTITRSYVDMLDVEWRR